MLRGIRNAWSLLRVREVALARAACPSCGPTLLVRLANDPLAVRCARCGASAIHLSIMQVLARLYPDLSAFVVYELSSRGPLFEYLKARAGRLVFSEFFDGVAPGEYCGGVQCQDVMRLTYPDASFDLCTSTEVFEHVPDDRAGFCEIRRVLKPTGRFVFTVPLRDSQTTEERAMMVGGEVHHLLPPEYHGDALRGLRRVLAFRNYGRDIVERLRGCGFRHADIVTVDDACWWGLGRRVIVAER